MKTRIVRIGNSQGIRIPKPLLEQAGLGEEVELRLEPDGILLAASSAPRAGWADAAQAIRQREGEGVLDGLVPTEFDETEWQW